jgi:transcriptional adapter 2-alpha
MTPRSQRVDPTLNENTDDFHARRKQRISSLTTQPPKDPPAVYTSAPTNHEILGFMPGRLEFDTEVENDAEDMIKDLEFGLVMQWGGADQPEAPPPPIDNDNADGDGEEDEETGRENLPIQKNNRRSQPLSQKRPRIEPVHSPPADPEPSPTNPFTDQMESPESVALKVSLIEVYNEKVDKREEAKTFVFDHGFLEFKKVTTSSPLPVFFSLTFSF